MRFEFALTSKRPWLLRKLSSNRYAASRTSCFEAAKLDFQIRQEFQRDVPDFRLFAITGQYKMFNSAMIAGISAIVDPRGPDSEQMRKILTTFLEENPWHEVANKDETTKKEVQIVSIPHISDDELISRFIPSPAELRKYMKTRLVRTIQTKRRRTLHRCCSRFANRMIHPLRVVSPHLDRLPV